MPGLQPQQYISPNSEYRYYNGDYYLYTANRTASNTLGTYGIGGTAEKLTPEEAQHQRLNRNSIYDAPIDPETWAKNGASGITDQDILDKVKENFTSSGSPAGYEDYLKNNQSNILTNARTYLSQNPTGLENYGGQVFNQFRYDPKNATAIQSIQAANNPARPEFTSQSQADTYAQTGKVTTPEQRNTMAFGNNPTSTPYSTAIDQTARNNDISITPPTPPVVPASGTSYSVKSGDTLSQIASKFNTTLNAILAANPNIKNPNLIYPNQQVVIPAINSNIDPAKAVNDAQDKMLNALNKSTPDKTGKDGIKIEKDVSTNDTPSDITFKIPSSADLYTSLMNTQEIKDLQSKSIDLNKQLNQITADEASYEQDIRSQVNGEMPESLIRAMAAEKSRALYPKKLALQAEATAIQSQLNQAMENAKVLFQAKLADRENGLKYLDTIVSSGATLTAEQYKLADEAIGAGSGFTKLYVGAKAKAAKAQTAEDQVKLTSSIFTLLDKVPEGQKVTINGLEYEGLKDAGNLVVKEYDTKTHTATSVTFDKKGKIISSEQKRITPTGITPVKTSPNNTTKPIPPKFNEKTEFSNVLAAAKTISGSDGKIAPWDYLSLRNTYVGRGGNPTTFDTKMKGFRDPSNPSYPVGK